MKKKYITGSLLLLALIFVACTEKTNEAKERLNSARQLYEAKLYGEAKSEIDSLRILYPKAIEERKAALALLDSVRHAADTQTMAISDSLLAVNAPILDSMKKLFILQKDAEYQTIGYYSPKETATSGGITHTTLRSAVSENGDMYIESVYLGAQRHDRIVVTVAKDESIESGVITSDGLNYTFSNMGQQFEVIRVEGENDKGIAKLIAENADKNITVDVIGKYKTSYTLSKPIKEAIGKSYRLSEVMLYSDSLATQKEQAQFNLNYLDNKEEVIRIKNELRENGEKMKNVDDM